MLRITDRIIDFESGELTEEEVIELFKDLESTGLLWQLQGFYQRTYFDLKEAGLLGEASNNEEE